MKIANPPTLLIGLGGMGCQVIDMVYGMIPPDRRKGVGVHGFDTDVNSIGQLKNIAGHVTQTSTTGMTVGEYVHREPQVTSWLQENPILYRKTLEAGAGQIRACSRLAFRSKMQEGGLLGLERELDSLFPVQGGEYHQGVRVLVVSSLAGGTGSGLFLQIAMNIRDIMATRFNRDRILIRGAFILPDILINSGQLEKTKIEQVRANAYASVKELNAITRAAWNNWGDYPGVTIELEYKPDQVDFEGRTIHAITLNQLPYDFCFLYDYENTSGENLKGSLDNYMDQVARSVYVQLFSPISDNQFSKEDNQIRSSMKDGGLNYICGSGVSTLVYPYDHLLDYCALKWGVAALDDSWLLLDKMFQDEMKAYEADRNLGYRREELKRGQRYIDDFNSRAHGENPSPFIRLAESQVRIMDENANPGKYKAELLIDALKKRVEAVLDADETLRRFDKSCELDRGRINLKDMARYEIADMEQRLESFRREIESKIPEYKTALYYEFMGLDSRSENRKENREYSLNTWMLLKNKPLHPVAVRFVLYQLEIQMESLITQLQKNNIESREKIKKYREIYDLKETDTRESAEDRVADALKQGLLGSLFKSSFKQFIEEYDQKSRSQRNALNEYKNNYLLELVLTSVLREVRGLIQEWERFFANLAETQSSLINELNRKERQYDQQIDPTVNIVLASSGALQNFWEEMRLNLVSNILPDDIAEQMYMALYRYHISMIRGELTEPVKVDQLYRENVLGYCREALRTRYAENLDMNVVQALRHEARLKGIPIPDQMAYIADRIKPLLNQARPFISDVQEVAELPYWGIHPDTETELGQYLCQDIFTGHEISDSAFSRYEIIAYKVQYGLLAEQLHKFSPEIKSSEYNKNAGSYFYAYKKQVKNLLTGADGFEYTPHLDKRWHLTAFMPDINISEIERDLENIDHAFIMGIVYDWLPVTTVEGSWVYQVCGDTTSLMLMNGNRVKGYPSELYRALGHNPVIVEYIQDKCWRVAEQDKNQMLPIEEHKFVKGIRRCSMPNHPEINNILDIVLGMPENSAGGQVGPDQAQKLINKVIDEVAAYYLDYFGPHREETAKSEACLLILDLWNSSNLQKSADRNSGTYRMWTDRIGNKLSELGYKGKWPLS